jgi:hypothetical protein
MTLRIPLQTTATGAVAILAIQSSVAAARGELNNVQNDFVTCIVPVSGPPDLVQQIDLSDPVMSRVNIEIDIAAGPAGSLLTFRAMPPLNYLLSALQLDSSTLKNIVITVQQTIDSMKRAQRPPDRTP